MSFEKVTEYAMGMDADKWRRHANPWSVWSRLSTVPLIALACYSRGWIGWWALALVALVGIWLWLNVRIFAPIGEPVRWESRAIFGEAMWLDRKSRQLPKRELRRTIAPLVASILAALAAAWGVIALSPAWTVAGSTGVIAGQIWFLRTLAGLYDAVTGQMETPGIVPQKQGKH